MNNASLNRTLLFVMAIAIHKLPEGLATGVSYNGDQGNAFAITLTIALQNIPEGMVVVTPLLYGWCAIPEYGTYCRGSGTA